MTPTGFYLSELNSFTDDLSKYDARLYLGLDDLSMARSKAKAAQKEAEISKPHPPPPIYIPGAVEHHQLAYDRLHLHGPSSAPVPARTPLVSRVPAPYCSAVPHRQAAFQPQYYIPQRPASTTPYSQGPALNLPRMETEQPRSTPSELVYMSASMLRNKLSVAPAQRQDNLFIRSTATYTPPPANFCRLPIGAQILYGQ